VANDYRLNKDKKFYPVTRGCHCRHKLWISGVTTVITSVVAVELEFYALDNSTRCSGRPKVPEQLNISGKPDDLQLYDMRILDAMQTLLSRVQSFAQIMNIPVETQLAEFGPGQFEINLKHQSNALDAADHAVLFKQLVDRAASECGMLASFMAKPYTQHAGCGQHVHVSLLNDAGSNVFDMPDGEKLQHGVAGALACERLFCSTRLLLVAQFLAGVCNPKIGILNNE